VSGQAEAAPPRDRVTRLRRRVGAVELRDYGIVVAFVALFVALTLSTSTFATTRNFGNILDQYAALGLLAIGETVCIIAGVFDLSAGAIVSVSGVVATKTALSVSPEFGLVAGVLTGVGLGVVNGTVIHLTRINSFIGTLATSIVFAGFAILITGGNIVTVKDAAFGKVGQNSVLGIKFTGWTFLVFTVLAALLLARTMFGRYVYAVGGNPEAARLSGIRVGLIRGACFAFSGAAAGLAGMLLASRTQSAQANLGAGMELTAISAAVVGGTSIFGGEGAVWRGFLGVLLLAIIGNGFTLLDIDTTYQQIVYGTLILVAVAADQLLRRRA
jgi:ribose transport system permease protein